MLVYAITEHGDRKRYIYMHGCLHYIQSYQSTDVFPNLKSLFRKKVTRGIFLENMNQTPKVRSICYVIG